MNEYNKKILVEFDTGSGDYLKENCQNILIIQDGRNPYAHIALSIKKNLIELIKILMMIN